MNKSTLKPLALLLVTLFLFTACQNSKNSSTTTIYSETENWAYYGEEATDKQIADCFFIAPTVYFAEDQVYNMAMDNETAKAAFLGASNMEKGIYDDMCKMYAPYYPQIALEVYSMTEEEGEEYFDIAYAGIREAFLYYMEEENQGRPLVLAGFSQGADMAIRLLKEFFGEEDYQNQLVACYAIGWGITAEELEEYPHLSMAQSAEDIGVIVSFNTEAEGITTSLMVPETTLAINPLNWSVDSSYASPSLNLGACFTDYEGEIYAEIENLTGAYLDPYRGTLIVDDAITPNDYPPVLTIFEEGIYHLYDYQFFYRNLEENVKIRVEAFTQN